MTNQVHTAIEHATPEQHKNLAVLLRSATKYSVRERVEFRVKEPILLRAYYPVADRLFQHLHPEPWWKYSEW